MIALKPVIDARRKGQRIAMQDILVIKHGALGDIIQAIDAFESLRRSFPDAHITVLTAPGFAPLLAASGWFDDVISDQRKPVWHLMHTVHMVRLFSRPFDAILDLQCSSRTATYFKLMRPKARWFGTVAGCSDPMPDFTGVNNRERMMTAVKMAGAKPYKGTLDFLGKASTDDIVKLPADYCVFIAGSSKAKPSKRWPASGFADIAARCLDEGVTPILCGTAEDKAANTAIKAACSGVIDLTAQTTLSQLASLMLGARFILGNDTGPVFLGARTNVPTCMLMGADTDPSMSAPVGDKADYLHEPQLAELPASVVWEKLLKMQG